MKKITKTLIVILIIALVILNPDKDDFNRKIHKITYGNKYKYEDMVQYGNNLIYETGYTRKNFVIFSFYETNGKTNIAWYKDGYKNKNVKFIGIMKTFIRLN